MASPTFGQIGIGIGTYQVLGLNVEDVSCRGRGDVFLRHLCHHRRGRRVALDVFVGQLLLLLSPELADLLLRQLWSWLAILVLLLLLHVLLLLLLM